jgi:hypothetical protein
MIINLAVTLTTTSTKLATLLTTAGIAAPNLAELVTAKANLVCETSRWQYAMSSTASAYPTGPNQHIPMDKIGDLLNVEFKCDSGTALLYISIFTN